jgi:hypothetical protein
MINPIQKLQTIIRTIPTMTMIPPVDIPAIPPRFSRSTMCCSFRSLMPASTAPDRHAHADHCPPSIRFLAAACPTQPIPMSRYQDSRFRWPAAVDQHRRVDAF